MAEITIRLPESVKQKIERNKINLALVITRVIKQLEEENEMIDWSVKLQRASRKGRLDELKRKGFI